MGELVRVKVDVGLIYGTIACAVERTITCSSLEKNFDCFNGKFYLNDRNNKRRMWIECRTLSSE